MTKKLTQKIFNEEMFYSIYLANLTESITVSPLLEQSLNELREQGYDVPSFVDDEFGDGDNYEDIPKLRSLVKKFTKRFEKLTGYDFE
tara:strand:+ start:226 stop:489 length:264 start_codon:yes stop_codon:yes gene_type:complete